MKTQVKKDAECQIATAESMGQDDQVTDVDFSTAAEGLKASQANDWCCMYRILSLQDDFVNEKPMIQHLIEGQGHICLFLPKFHCKLNLIEMVWGFAKYCEYCLDQYHGQALILTSGFRNTADGKFGTAKVLVPQCLNICDTLTIQCFFRKTWHYMDAYQYALHALPFSCS